MKALAANFVPAADEVWRLQHGKDAECKLFQGFMEKGHYGGRVQPTDTRQGTYCCTPSGQFLASCNTNDPKQMAGMLRTALSKWKEMTQAVRLSSEVEKPSEIQRPETKYPKDGLVLQVIVRDLPREDGKCPDDWRKDAWNQDYAWFTRREAAQLLPATLEVGAKGTTPAALISRLARAHLIDTVRGQSSAYQNGAIESAWLETRIDKIAGDRVSLTLFGASQSNEKGSWSVNGFADMNDPSANTRGIDCKLLGSATYDRSKGKFVQFELVAAGQRHGATQYNGRADDPGPAPIGFVFRIAPDLPQNHVAPTNFWVYNWQ